MRRDPQPRRVHRGLAKPRIVVAGFAAEDAARVAPGPQAGPPKQTGADELLELDGSPASRVWPGHLPDPTPDCSPDFGSDNLLWHRRRGLATDEQIITARTARARREGGGGGEGHDA